jgi:hypothetical protein
MNDRYAVPCYNTWSFINNLFQDEEILEHYHQFFPALTQFLSAEFIKMELLKKIEIDFHTDTLLDNLDRFIVSRHTVEHSAELDRFKIQIKLLLWIHDYIYIHRKNFMMVQNDPNDYSRLAVYIWDKERIYHISASYDGKHHDYLGATYSCRAPNVGEFHTRGNDLPDGMFNHDTLDEIMKAILRLNVEVF